MNHKSTAISNIKGKRIIKTTIIDKPMFECLDNIATFG